MAIVYAINTPKTRARRLEVDKKGNVVLHGKDCVVPLKFNVVEMLNLQRGQELEAPNHVIRRSNITGLGWTQRLEIYYTKHLNLLIVTRKGLRAAARRAGVLV
ncbi:MAG: hypothetical protein ACOZAO_00735 [Patescibacteria group bacterium]